MDERVDPVCQLHQARALQEEFLNVSLNEYPQGLLDPDQLQRMLAGNIDSVAFESQRSKRAPKLVGLRTRLGIVSMQRGDGTVYPVHQRPVPAFHQERKTSEDTAQKAMSKDGGVR